ncbi:hypothetical protein GF312_17630 [Candidatus Poribacteria bacterium]|nr:hypothetical protein [Candidatus Poribacteria bacterium]
MNKIIKLARSIEIEWIKSRYPDWPDTSQPVWTTSEQYNKSDAEKVLSDTIEVYDTVIDVMKSKLNFKE